VRHFALQLALIAVAATLTAVIGGVAGYGTGALMPLILVPIVGAEPVVPIGVAVFPGAFFAKALVARLPVAAHTAILDAVVMTGGALMIVSALRG